MASTDIRLCLEPADPRGSERDDEVRRAKAGQLVEALNSRDLDWLDTLYHDDVVIHWPQSGEVIRGKHNIRKLREAYPTPPTATLGRIIGSGAL